MIFDESGLSLKSWKEQLVSGEKATLEGFLERVKSLNLRNSIFVDVTANEDVSKIYADYLRESIAVVACNKIACSSSFENYSNLKKLSVKYNAPFLFETNVGAGLPIIDTLNHLIASGDKITSIQAVLSGILNFVVNHHILEPRFDQLVRQAQEEGYTDTDPKFDVSWIDAIRKNQA